MTVGLSAANLANKWLDMLAGTAFTAPAAFWAKLHTADPGAAGATAAAVGDATRKQVTWAAASGGSKSMSSMSGGWTNGGTSETLTHLSFWDASSAGNFLGSCALTASQAWASTNTFSLTSLSISFTPIAA
ncbi:MAG: phage tail fiber protein [Mycobacteriaceae bacterium]